MFGEEAVIRGLWPRTWRGWSAYALGLGTFIVLNVLVVLGSDLALKLLITLVGMLAGGAVASAIIYPFRARFAASGSWRMAGIFLGLALVFGIIFGGSALTGVPAFPTAESGAAGTLIYGLAFGFGVSISARLGLSGTSEWRRESEGPELRVLAVVLGTVAGLFALLFALYLLIEYVAVPLIQYLAA